VIPILFGWSNTARLESQSVTILDIVENHLLKETLKFWSKEKYLPNVKRAVFDQPNKIGITPLEMAAYFGKPRMLNRLPLP
jgi:ankyrin repeat protein